MSKKELLFKKELHGYKKSEVEERIERYERRIEVLEAQIALVDGLKEENARLAKETETLRSKVTVIFCNLATDTPPTGSELHAWSRLMPSAAAEMLSGSVTRYDSPAPAKTQMRQPSSERAMGVPVLA